MAPLAALQHEIEPRIRGHNVLFEQLANAISRVRANSCRVSEDRAFTEVMPFILLFHLLFRKSRDITAWSS